MERIIASEEKNIGKVISITALVLLVFVLLNSMSLFSSSAKPGGWFLLIPFFVICALMLVIGRYQQKKYDRLGATPLKLSSDECKLGQSTRATITVGYNDFTRVNQLSLKCWRRNSSSETTSYDEVWGAEITPTIRACPMGTELEFDIVIPADKKPTNRGGWGAKKYHWELSFEYVEAMTAIKRTWKIPVSR